LAEGVAEEKPRNRWRHWKHIVLFIALASVLTGSLIYYVTPDVFHPLRTDKVPAGAYIVPWMQPSPSIDTLEPDWWNNEHWDPDMVMASALKLNMTFTITIPNGTRVIPSVVYLGHDTEYLYVAGKFRGMYRNPYAGKDDGIPQYVALFFDANNDGILTYPESGSRFMAGFGESNRWNPGGVSGCDDMIWTRDPWNWYQHDIWLSAENYYNDRNVRLPKPATLNNTWEYDNSTGTWMVLFSRYLLGSDDPHTNAFIMRNGERWVVGFNLELGYTPGGVATEMLADGWPQKTYPYLSNDASWWPKLVLDLSNPPPWLYP